MAEYLSLTVGRIFKSHVCQNFIDFFNILNLPSGILASFDVSALILSWLI